MIRLLAGMLVTVTSFLFGCSAFSAPVPEVNQERAVVISGVIADGNILPLGNRLLRMTEKDTSPVDIIIDSPGGEVITGFLFLNQLETVRARGVTVRCFVPGVAASMAFQILVHCDERYVANRSFLLWHRVRVGIMGILTAPDARTLARDLQKMDDLILEETVLALPQMSTEDIVYHFEKETFHIGEQLCDSASKFCTASASLPGVLEALSSPKVPSSNSTRPRKGLIIYMHELLAGGTNFATGGVQ